jgi:hypothetical protein
MPGMRVILCAIVSLSIVLLTLSTPQAEEISINSHRKLSLLQLNDQKAPRLYSPIPGQRLAQGGWSACGGDSNRGYCARCARVNPSGRCEECHSCTTATMTCGDSGGGC